MVLTPLYPRPSFLNASVVGWSSQIGWGEQQSQLTLRLVQDPTNLDVFTPVPTGTPAVFVYGDFAFEGLLQRWGQRNSPDGFTFEATLVDPRGILEGTQVVVRDYNGATNAVSNLLNAYGFWEDPQYGNGFGGSLVNDAGMPWYLVLSAIEQMTSNPDGTPYGGPLSFRGVRYDLDLSNLPTPPKYYRVGASDNLLTMISQICQDGGCDFFIQLAETTIIVRTVSRYRQPPLGTIFALTNLNWGGLLKSSEAGLESRNEVTSSFLVGGERQDLFLANETAISSFWGFDNLGFPIIGTPQQTLWTPAWNVSPGGSPAAPAGYIFPGQYINAPPEPPVPMFSDTQPEDFGPLVGGLWNFKSSDPTKADAQIPVPGFWSWVKVANNIETMTLNATMISYILGSNGYPCSTLEMRCALANQETWAAYISANRPDVAKILGDVFSPFAVQQGVGQVFQQPRDMVSDAPGFAQALDEFVTTDVAMVRQTELYRFVEDAARKYFGRTYLVSIPFAAVKTVPDTLQIVFSQQPANDGAFLEAGSNPLGLYDYNEDFFRTDDGKFVGFARYDTDEPIFFGALQPDSMVLQDNGVYVKGSVEAQVYLNPLPCVVVELSSPVYNPPNDPLGDTNVIAAILKVAPDQFGDVMADMPGGTANLLISPDVIRPTSIAVPLRSNVLSYGPWYVAGPPGKVLFEYDNSLVPWNFGSIDDMNNAGVARVVNAVTFQQEGETGHLDLAIPPSVSLGEALETGGPEVTSINVAFDGKGGISTQYEFRTWSPRFGVIPKNYIERIQRLGQTNMKLKRAVRQVGRSLWQLNVLGSIANQGAAVNANILGGSLKVARPQTPHPGLAMKVYPDANAGGLGVSVYGSSMTSEELVRASRASHPDQFQATAIMSMEGFLRPFTTNKNAYSMSQLAAPNPSGYDFPLAMTSQTHNPFMKGHDIGFVAWGDEYEGLNAFRNTPDPDNTRALALRAPLLLTGWGWGMDGYAYPGGSGLEGKYIDGVLRRSDKWKTGVLDILWDDYRGVWTVHDALTVVIPSGSSLPAQVRVYDPLTGSDTGMRIRAENWFNTSVETTGGDLKAIINYISTANCWVVVATDCQ